MPRLFSLCAFVSALAGLAIAQSPAAVVLQVGNNFTGATLGGDSQAEPADANGAAGPAHYVEFINGRFSVYNKSNGSRVQTMTDQQFWTKAGVALPSNLDVTDPRLAFDPGSRRWFASEIDFDSLNEVTNRFLLAVSTSADPTQAWKGFGFVADPDTGGFADFPTFGLDGRGVYLGADMFDASGNPLGPLLVAIPKSGLLSGAPGVALRTSFGVLDSAARGEVMQPAVTYGPASTGEFVLAVGSTGNDFQPHSNLVAETLQNVDGVGRALLGNPVTLAIPAYNVPINPKQPNGQDNLDNGDARFSSTVYRLGDMAYAVHSTEVNGRAALQWFRIDARASAVIESGVIADPDLDLFYPSIAANADGIVVIACNGCSTLTYVSSYAAVGEPIQGSLVFGQMQLLKAGAANYGNAGVDGTSRWGDYSATSADPSDPNRFWTIQSYPSSATTWSTRITELIVNPLRLQVTSLPGNVLLTWPASASGFQLQTRSSLSPDSPWTAVADTPNVSGNQFNLLMPISGAGALYRLIKP